MTTHLRPSLLSLPATPCGNSVLALALGVTHLSLDDGPPRRGFGPIHAQLGEFLTRPWRSMNMRSVSAARLSGLTASTEHQRRSARGESTVSPRGTRAGVGVDRRPLLRGGHLPRSTPLSQATPTKAVEVLSLVICLRKRRLGRSGRGKGRSSPSLAPSDAFSAFCFAWPPPLAAAPVPLRAPVSSQDCSSRFRRHCRPLLVFYVTVPPRL